jgi:eukaryotic-like serine/threonine-protein kinase
LKAAASIGINEPGKAIPDLGASGNDNQTLFAAYLRGMAHTALGQTPEATIDFQEVLARRGEASMQDGELYPMAGISVARNYKSSRTQPEKVETYRPLKYGKKEAKGGL